MLRAGCVVERLIEGMWFAAIIEHADAKDQSLTLKYCDDGNVEEMVPFDEVRMADRKVTNASNNTMRMEEKPCKKDTLPRPLAGFIEDDSLARNSQVPTVVVHVDTDIENAIIINGAESKLAAGGGLRALRYLKPR